MFFFQVKTPEKPEDTERALKQWKVVKTGDAEVSPLASQKAMVKFLPVKREGALKFLSLFKDGKAPEPLDGAFNIKFTDKNELTIFAEDMEQIQNLRQNALALTKLRTKMGQVKIRAERKGRKEKKATNRFFCLGITTPETFGKIDTSKGGTSRRLGGYT